MVHAAPLTGATMGTTWSVTVQPCLTPVLAQRMTQAIQACLNGLCDAMSHWQATSLLSRLNAAPVGWYALPTDFYTVLRTGLDTARASGGAYDPTLGELAALWGFGPQKIEPANLPPTANALHLALARSGWERTQLNPTHCAVWQPGGLHFDLSSIAKGYAVDKISELLLNAGLVHHLIEIGGELKAHGERSLNTPWRVRIDTPHASAPLLTVLRGGAMATSGNYRRVHAGPIPGLWHTLHPKTGTPVRHALASVTVLHPQCMVADALATALLVMGPEHGYNYAQKHRLAALFMRNDHAAEAIYWTPQFQTLAA